MTFVAGQRITASMLNKDYMQADTTTTTVTAATQTRLSTAYTIAANDAQAGTVYKLIAMGSGTQGSTAQTLAIRLNTVGGAGLNAYTIASSFAVISHNFRWHVESVITIPSTGAAVKPILFTRGMTFDATGGSLITSFMNEYDSSGGTTIDTTNSWGLQFECAWGSTIGSPTISCLATVFERGGA
nr:hypothetical protein Hi04_10k_c361_00007 [uncultured bacterium]